MWCTPPMLGSVYLVVVGVRKDACVIHRTYDPEHFALKVIVSIELERERVTCRFPGSSDTAHGMLLQGERGGTPRSGDAPSHAGSIILWCVAGLPRAAHHGMI